MQSFKYILSSWFFLFLMDTTLSITYKKPIIGILTQEPCLGVEKHFKEYKSYLPASYVKSVEASGAGVIPIFIGEQESYYRKLMNQVNGVVIPGGGASFYAEDGYARAGAIIFNIAKELNLKRDFFPILAICLGMQLMLHVSNGESEIRTRCDSYYENLPLQFDTNYRESLLFGRAPTNIIQDLSVVDVTHNWHVWCITPENLTDSGLNQEWNPLSYNINNRGVVFISSVEHKTFPFVGLQFHPEKNPFEYNIFQNIPNTMIAIESSRYFFDWLINSARRNFHEFENEKEIEELVISNYCPYHTKIELGIGYEQIYLFNRTNNTV